MAKKAADKKITGSVQELLDKGLVMWGDDSRLDIRRLPTIVPGFDDLLGGGWPAGRYTQIVGPESTGKTVLLQYAVASQQQSEDRPVCLVIDFERSFDRVWWQGSGVDTDKLLVSQPMFGEEGIDTILAVIEAEPKLGLVGVDSIAVMMPRTMVEAEKGSEQNFIGKHAALVGKFFTMITPQIDDIVFILLNQMRANIGGYEENYPGGWWMRHSNHITLRTRRDEWLKEGDTRIGFMMEVINRKNKVGGVQNASLLIPFKFKGQIDMIQSYIDEAMERKLIIAKPPFYEWDGNKYMGKARLRQHFMDEAESFAKLKEQLA